MSLVVSAGGDDHVTDSLLLRSLWMMMTAVVAGDMTGEEAVPEIGNTGAHVAGIASTGETGKFLHAKKL